MPLLSNTIDRIRTSGANVALKESMTQWPFWSSRSMSGPTVTDESALGLTAFYRGVVLIASTAGGQPIHVFEETPEGKNRLKTVETSYLWRRPNPEMTNQTFWETVIGHEVMGDAFLFVVKNRDGGVATSERPNADGDWGIWYIEPWRVRTGRTKAGQKVYEVDNELPMIDYKDGGEIVHVPNWGRDSLRGINPVRVGREAIGLGLSAQEYAARYFSQSETPPGLITTEQSLTPAQAEEISNRWQRQRAGLGKMHRTAVLGNGAKFTQVMINPQDAQLMEARKMQRSEVSTLLGVPPHMIGDTEKASSWGTGLIEQTQGFVTYTLQYHINRFEQAINDALLVRELTNQYVKFDLTGLLRGNALQQAQIYAIGYGRWWTPNDIRRDYDLPPVEGGDEMPAPSNIIALKDLENSEFVKDSGDRANGGDS